jgi:hypothetical protein
MDKDLADQVAGIAARVVAKAGGILATAEHVPGPRPGDH